MKKHNEGYALVLVLVVITVLCLVSMAMTAASLKNLKNQQDSIERMEAKYAAQGEIEKFVATFEGMIYRGGAIPTITALKQADLDTICGAIGMQQITLIPVDNGETDRYLLLEIKTKADAEVAISCTIRVTGEVIENNYASGEKYYNITNPKWEYVVYTITENIPDPTTEGGGGAG